MAVLTKVVRGASVAFATQAVVVVLNLVSGILLARELSVDDRGVAALISLGTTLLGFLGGLGLSELIVRSTGTVALTPRAVVAVVAGAVAVALVGPVVLLVADDRSTAATVVTVGVITLLSAQNSWVMAALFTRYGIGVLAVLQLCYSLSVLVGFALLAWTQGALSVPGVSAVWLSAEVVILVICFVTLARGRSLTLTERLVGAPVQAAGSTGADMGVELISARRVSGAGLAHSLAQVGVSLADRGLVLLATVVGGLPATAQITVAQSAGSPMSMPVQALTNPLLAEAKQRRGPRLTYGMVAGTTVVLAAVAAAVAYPHIIVALFGPSYAELERLSWMIVLFGVFAAAWRLLHIWLRGTRRPSAAMASDVAALSAATLLAAVHPSGEIGWLLVYLVVYAAAGLVAALVLSVSARTPSVTERHGPSDIFSAEGGVSS